MVTHVIVYIHLFS